MNARYFLVDLFRGEEVKAWIEEAHWMNQTKKSGERGEEALFLLFLERTTSGSFLCTRTLGRKSQTCF